MRKIKDYPDHAFENKKEWLRNVRKRWTQFRKYNNQENNVKAGCYYYPEEVYEWLNKFEKMDKLMKYYYRNT